MNITKYENQQKKETRKELEEVLWGGAILVTVGAQADPTQADPMPTIIMKQMMNNLVLYFEHLINVARLM